MPNGIKYTGILAGKTVEAAGDLTGLKSCHTNQTQKKTGQNARYVNSNLQPFILPLPNS